MDNLEEMDKVLERYNLLRLNQEETENMNRPVTSTQIENDSTAFNMGLPWWLSGKESACNAGATGHSGSISGSGRSPRGGHSNLLQSSCLENLMDRGTWQATVHGVTNSQTLLKQLSMHRRI